MAATRVPQPWGGGQRSVGRSGYQLPRNLARRREVLRTASHSIEHYFPHQKVVSPVPSKRSADSVHPRAGSVVEVGAAVAADPSSGVHAPHSGFNPVPAAYSSSKAHPASTSHSVATEGAGVHSWRGSRRERAPPAPRPVTARPAGSVRWLGAPTRGQTVKRPRPREDGSQAPHSFSYRSLVGPSDRRVAPPTGVFTTLPMTQLRRVAAAGTTLSQDPPTPSDDLLGASPLVHGVGHVSGSGAGRWNFTGRGEALVRGRVEASGAVSATGTGDRMGVRAGPRPRADSATPVPAIPSVGGATADPRPAKRRRSSECADDDLRRWGVPGVVAARYEAHGIRKLHAWQVKCLQTPGVCVGPDRDLVYSAPTSGGKTLVAEVLMLRALLQLHAPGSTQTRVHNLVIYALPYVSVVLEKVEHLRSVFGPMGWKIVDFQGAKKLRRLSTVHIAVCTLEKANSLVTRLFDMEVGKAEVRPAVLVLDEVHCVGEDHRGVTVELLVAKTRLLCPTTRIVGFSATLAEPSLRQLAEWFGEHTATFSSGERPVPLRHKILFRGHLWDPSTRNNPVPQGWSPDPGKPLDRCPDATPVLSDAVLRKFCNSDVQLHTQAIHSLCIGGLFQEFGVLAFCGTRRACSQHAVSLAKAIHRSALRLPNDPRIGQRRTAVRRALLHLPKHSKDQLELVRFGVAFHHAGLTVEERGVVEDAFRDGVVRVLFATTTVATGVNLPARRVIICNSHMNRRLRDLASFKQMAGRAGRQGLDETGECILCVQSGNLASGAKRARFAEALRLHAAHTLPLVRSSVTSKMRMRRVVLEIATSARESLTLDALVTSVKTTTLWGTQTGKLELRKQAVDAIQWLSENEFLREADQAWGTTTACTPGATLPPRVILPTNLGLASLQGGLPPDSALSVCQDLTRVRRAGFDLTFDLSLVFHITPVDMDSLARKLVPRGSQLVRAVASWADGADIASAPRVDSREGGHTKATSREILIQQRRRLLRVLGVVSDDGRIDPKTRPESEVRLKRLVVATRLMSMLRDSQPRGAHDDRMERPMGTGGLDDGDLQLLKNRAASFSRQVVTFCQALNWNTTAKLLSKFHDKLHFGVKRELVPLVRLKSMMPFRARELYAAGIKTVFQLATTPAADMERVLLRNLEFQAPGTAKFEENLASVHHLITNLVAEASMQLARLDPANVCTTRRSLRRHPWLGKRVDVPALGAGQKRRVGVVLATVGQDVAVCDVPCTTAQVGHPRGSGSGAPGLAHDPGASVRAAPTASHVYYRVQVGEDATEVLAQEVLRLHRAGKY